jgi:hypothetical protein
VGTEFLGRGRRVQDQRDVRFEQRRAVDVEGRCDAEWSSDLDWPVRRQVGQVGANHVIAADIEEQFDHRADSHLTTLGDDLDARCERPVGEGSDCGETHDHERRYALDRVDVLDSVAGDWVVNRDVRTGGSSDLEGDVALIRAGLDDPDGSLDHFPPACLDVDHRREDRERVLDDRR